MLRLHRLAFSLVLVLPRLSVAQESPIDFSRDIRPILSDTCYRCHGPDGEERQTDMRLDLKDSALAKLESGLAPIQPGNSVDSEVYKRITTTDDSLRMPPAKSGKKLTAEQIALIKRWIDQGATWKEHWSFVPPRRPALPPVKNASAIRNPIDYFIQAKVEQVGLEPMKEADKPTLLRRLTFDLTGLPPSVADLDAFIADSSPAAFERAIDRLLNSPRYGEHMARYWLDAARYGDTHGLHLDNERSVWLYRDWVINAFNRNQPFDEFTVEQLAGDLLPNPTIEQKVATGFNRCNVTTSEGGSIDAEYFVRYAVDRVETTSTVFLGLTTGCAVCHDHKYDPISQKEFYGLFAYFYSLTERAMDGNAPLPPPFVKVPTRQQADLLAEYNAKAQVFEMAIQTELAKIKYEEPASLGEAKPSESREFVWIDDELPRGAKQQSSGDGTAGWKFVSGPDNPVLSGKTSTQRTCDGLSQHFFDGATATLLVGEGDRLFAYVYLDAKNPPKQIMLQFNDGSWEHRATWGGDHIPWGQPNTPGRHSLGALPELGKWIRLEVPADKVGLKPGSVINGWAFTQFGGTAHWDKAGIVTAVPQDGSQFDSLLAWEAVQKRTKAASLPKPIQDILAVELAKRSEAQKKQLVDYFVANVYSKTRGVFDPLHKQRDEMRAKAAAVDQTIPATLTMEDAAEVRPTHVLVRGQYDKPGEKVAHGVPAVLPPLPHNAAPNRLSLAHWLVDRGHPLTARVVVNRLWQQCFGTGLVKTAEDFGSQGEFPTHPELLDWLAVEFIDSGWDIKHIVHLILTSAAYRRSTLVTPENLAKDPENRLLARGPRFRLDAELVRNNALAVSGLLVEKLGGRSVKPYQPSGLWEVVAYTSSNTANFVQDHGEALYRRSMYTFWKRTSPPPGMSAFDAPSRESCTVRRARTNTPLQALALMNDVQYVEAARMFAERIVKEGGKSTPERIQYAFRLATARSPRSEEIVVIQKTLEEHLATFKQDPKAAENLLSSGEYKRDQRLDAAEHAAWTMTANLILNLDETVTKG